MPWMPLPAATLFRTNPPVVSSNRMPSPPLLAAAVSVALTPTQLCSTTTFAPKTWMPAPEKC